MDDRTARSACVDEPVVVEFGNGYEGIPSSVLELSASGRFDGGTPELPKFFVDLFLGYVAAKWNM